MAKQRHLKNAPITEALFDFRVKARSDLAVDDLKNAHEELKSEFPKMDERRAFVFEAHSDLSTAGTTAQHKDLGVAGYRFASSDALSFAQFSLDGLTFNRLKPYTSWEDLFPQVERTWATYRDVARPISILRLAVRFLNRVPLPNATILEQYLAAPPVIPEGLPKRVSAFLSRMTLTDSQNELSASIGQALERTAVPNQPVLLLDIEVFRAFNSPDLPIDSPQLPLIFRQMRDLKNRIFFGLLTDDALESLA